MEYCVLLENADVNAALKRLGLGELNFRANTPSKEHPFCMAPVSEGTAKQIASTYGVQGDRYDSERMTLDMQYATASRLIAAVLGACAYNIGELKMLDNGQLLVRFHPRAFEEKREVTYCGFLKNIETGQYDSLFVTSASAILAVERAKEHAAQTNAHCEKRAAPPAYDMNDVLVQQKTIRSVQTAGSWGRISDAAEQALRDFVERNGDVMPHLEEPDENKSGGEA